MCAWPSGQIVITHLLHCSFMRGLSAFDDISRVRVKLSNHFICRTVYYCEILHAWKLTDNVFGTYFRAEDRGYRAGLAHVGAGLA